MLVSVSENATDEERRWRPSEEACSLAQILGPLPDEEPYDFRTRLQSTLNDPEARWAPTDPASRRPERPPPDAAVEPAICASTGAFATCAGALAGGGG